MIASPFTSSVPRGTGIAPGTRPRLYSLGSRTSTNSVPFACSRCASRGWISVMRCFASCMSSAPVLGMAGRYACRDASVHRERGAIGVERGGEAERQRPLLVDVSDGGVGDAGDAGDGGDLVDDVVEAPLAVVGGLRTVGEGAEDEARDAREHAGEAKLLEHPVDAVHRFADVLEHEDRAVEWREVGRAGERGEKREVPPHQPALGDATTYRARAVRGAAGIRAVHDRTLQRVARKGAERTARRGSVEGGEAAAGGDRGVQRR